MAPVIEVTGHLDGYALRFEGKEVAVFHTWDRAVEVLRAVQAVLAATFTAAV